jgi:hypothetical protein
MVLNIRRRRAERLGMPVSEDHHKPGWGGMPLGDIILASRQRFSETHVAEQVGARG